LSALPPEFGTLPNGSGIGGVLRTIRVTRTAAEIGQTADLDALAAA
jgi:predicted ABC-type sugar transport system permease subunit